MNCVDVASGWTALYNPLGVCTPGELVVVAFQGFAGLMGAIAIAFTVFSGLKLIIATNEEAIKEGRESVKWSVLGFVVSLLSFTAVAGVAKLLGVDIGRVNPDGTRVESPTIATDFIDAMNLLMRNFLGLLGFAAILMIVYYGYKYMTSAGNEEAVEQAKVGLRWTVLGLIIVLLAFTIIAGVRKLLLGT